MTTLNLQSPQFYRDGEAGVSGVVGYESRMNRVVRYTLPVPAAGASQVRLAFSGLWRGNGTMPSLRYFLGTDPESHRNAGADAPYTGDLTRGSDGLSFAAGTDLLLLPGQTWYVWVFPATTTFGWYYWPDEEGTALAALGGAAVSGLWVEPGTLGSPQTVTLTPYDTGLTHTLTCTLGSRTLTVCENTAETALTWTPPLDLALELPTADRGQAVYTLTTYREGTALGTAQAEAPLTVPEAVVPTLEVSLSDSSPAADLGLWVQNISQPVLEAAVTPALGSPIRSTRVTLDGEVWTPAVLRLSGDRVLALTVTDGRGRSASREFALHVAAYEPPAVRVDARRCAADGTPDDMGDHAQLSVSWSYTDLPGNEASLALTWGGEGESLPLATPTGDYIRQVAAPSVSTLAIAAQVTDRLCPSARSAMTLSVGYATLDILAGGRGIAFGTTAGAPGFTCAMDTDFRGCRVTGLAAPQDPADAVTKAYADSRVPQVEAPLALVGEKLTLPLASRVEADSPLPVTAGAVHAALSRPQTVAVEAGVPLDLALTEGRTLAIGYATDHRQNGDIFVTVNGSPPDTGWYTYSGTTAKYDGGILTYAGSAPADFQGFLRVLGGRIYLWGSGLRGNGTGVGWCHNFWTGNMLEQLAFSRAGTLTYQYL